MTIRFPLFAAIMMLTCVVVATSPALGGQGTGTLVINELMASNSKTAPDPQGQYDDWIELWNSGAQSINVAGMYLTDDPATPTKWRFPTNRSTLTTIPAGGYLLIWADGDTADTGLHASFRLSSGGDTAALIGTDGKTVIDTVEFGEQMTDVSYGRDPAATDQWLLLSHPTPNAKNINADLGFVADTKFSHDRGFYDQPFSVTITSATEGAVIYYTVDGSSPFDSIRDQPTGRPYAGPVSITTTTCLRAVAVKPGWEPSNVDTQTYIFLADVCQQATNPATGAQVVPPGYPSTWPGGSTSGPVTGDYQMDPDVIGSNGKDKFGGLYAKTIKDDLKSVPTVSLVMSRDDWFGPSGIYINESLDGQERVCSLEWIDPNGQGGFQINCAVAMQGGISGGGTSLDRWKTFKLSIRPRFKTTTDDGRPTGGPSQLHHRIFPDSPVEYFDTFVFDEVLSNAFNHSSQHMYPTYLQDQFVSDLHNVMGGQSPHGLYLHLYINGLYWGMYYLHERPDHAWAAQMFGGEKEEYDALKHSPSMTVNDGIGGKAATNFSAMLRAADAVAADPTNLAKYDALCRVLDIDNFITDLLAHWFAVNWDWPEKNWYATHRSPNGLWRFHTWDAEHSLEYWSNQNTLGMSVSGIHDKLKASADYRMHFADVVHRNFFNGGPLSLPFVTDLYRARMAQIDRAIVGESARWGDARQATPHTRQDWVTIQDGILSRFLQPRPAFVLNWLKGAGLYPNVDAPVFNINGTYQHGGHAAANAALSMQASATVWYTLDGSDPRVPGTTPQAGNSLAIIPEDTAKRVLVPTGPVNDAWRTSTDFADTSWISGTGGVGYERSSGFESYFRIDLRTQMYGVNTSCYIRVPFTVSATDLASLTSLTLRIRYDDGFIAYLNGTEVQRDMFNGTPAWNSGATANRPDSDAIKLAPFDLTAHIGKLHAGTNLLAVQALNYGPTSSDFLFSFELVGEKASPGDGASNPGVLPTAIKYASPTTLTKSVRVKSRALSGSTWSALNEAVFAVGPVAQNLRISEIMYHPAETGNPNDPNTEFIELTNIGNTTINLGLVTFSNGVDFTFPSYDLAAGRYCVVVRDKTAFQAKYGSSLPVAGQYAGSLNNAGERIELLDAAGTVIHSFRFQDNWFDLADGLGFSLTIKDPKTADPNGYGDKSLWRPSAKAGGSPGADDGGQVPALGSVVINELLANSDQQFDWIELCNTTGQAINIGGWYLSDDANDLTKYKIGAGTSLPANGYLVFYEDRHFGNKSDPGCKTPFALSSNGETVYLHSGSAGVLTGYSEQENFDASEAGVTLGRYEKSTGTYNFVALSKATPGAANAAPKVGPVVINEIMYHPDAIGDAEYVELLNISSSPVTLYDAVEKAPWRFTDDPEDPGIELLLPINPPVTLAAGEYLLLVKDASQFNSKYAPPASVKIFAWGPGNLANGAEKIQLSKPGVADADGGRNWIRVDRVVYSDGSHPADFPEGTDPWPTKADGQGSSLSRTTPGAYGNDAGNWHAATPSPGKANN
jgi:hypothetical protein